MICGTLMSLVHLSLYISVYKDKITYLPGSRSQLFCYSPLVWYCLKRYRQERIKGEDGNHDLVVRIRCVVGEKII